MRSILGLRMGLGWTSHELGMGRGKDRSNKSRAPFFTLFFSLACALLATLLLLAVLPTLAHAETCPNEALRQGPSANLPDCRAYELVSPPNKNGGQVEGGFNWSGGTGSTPQGVPQQASLNGEAVTYGSGAVFDETEATSGSVVNQYLSTRTPAGWSTREIVPAQNLPAGRFQGTGGAVADSLFQGFSEDLSHAFLAAFEPQPVAGAPLGYYNPYVRDDATGAYTLLSAVTPPSWKAGTFPIYGDEFQGFVVRFAGGNGGTAAAPVFSHVIFEADDALTPGAVPGHKNLYEYNAGEGLELVSVLPPPDGKAAEMYGANAEERLHNEIEVFGFGSSHNGAGGKGGSGEDKSPNYVHAISADGSLAFWTGPEGVLYLHERTGSGARTLQLSAAAAEFWAASADGTLAYFTGEGVDGGGYGLYQYDHATGAETEIAPAGGSVLGTSEDGSYVYFVSPAVLTGAPDAAGQSPAPGGSNLYLWHAGSTLFLAPGDGAPENGLFQEGGDTLVGADLRTARVTPNGLFVVFNSSEPLTGYDSDGKSEVFEYSALANRVVCVSCNPSGLPPTGRSFTPIEYHTEDSVPGWTSTTVQQRYVNDEGRVFFDSSDALLPQASNGKVNVYEYEWPGTGSCQGAAGCIYLISTGVSSENSWFLDASANGENVFFLTSQQLVGQDRDEALDVYDARVDGGFPYGGPPPCTGEACRASIAPAPSIYTAPPSETFEGAGNPVSPPAVTISKPAKKPAAKTKKKAKPKKKRKKAKRAKRASRDRRAKR